MRITKHAVAAVVTVVAIAVTIAHASPEQWRVLSEDERGRPTRMEFLNRYSIVPEDVEMTIEPVRMVPVDGKVVVAGVSRDISEGQKRLFWNNRGGVTVFWRHLEQKGMMTNVNAAEEGYVNKILGKVVRVTRTGGIESFGIARAVPGGTGQAFMLDRSGAPLYDSKAPTMVFHRDGITSISVMQ